MKTTILTAEDIGKIVQKVGVNTLMDELIERFTAALQTYDPLETVIPIRSGFSYTQPSVGLVEWMPVMKTGSQAAIKVVGYHPENPTQNGLPTIISTMSAYDTCTGHLLGLADCTFLTALRTGAASAVASRLMAAGDSRVVGIIGCGSQAVTQLHALSRVFEIQQVLVYDVNPKVSQSFPRRTAFLGLDIIPVNLTSIDQLLSRADILTTCTSVAVGEGPVFEDKGLKPAVHINAVGSDFPGKCEVPLSVLKRSFVCPDFPAQARVEGECQQLDPGDIGPAIDEVVKNSHQYSGLKSQSTVFDSTGWALEDQVALDMIFEYADQLGVGEHVLIENIADDPHDPYFFVRTTLDHGSANPD